jgi:nucleoside-diphosphate-sugar epimerase
MPLKSVSILGCGWLGLPLGRKLAASGYTVQGSTTTPSKISVLENSNIIPYHLTCKASVEGENVADFFKADALFVNIPFRRDLADPRIYLEQVRSIVPCAVEAKVKRVVFASSTVVYPALGQTAREEDGIIPADERVRVLLETERLLLDDRRFATTVLRFAGLYGPERPIGNFFKTGKIAKDADAPVNLIHLDDCIGIVEAVISKNVGNEIFNACGDGHPRRRELYTAAAKAAGLTPPVFETAAKAGFKIVDNTKLKTHLNYRFIHPDPLKDLA